MQINYRHVLSGSLLEIEGSARVSAADADVLALGGVGVGVDADHALVDVVEELLAAVVGHDGPEIGIRHVLVSLSFHCYTVAFEEKSDQNLIKTVSLLSAMFSLLQPCQ